MSGSMIGNTWQMIMNSGFFGKFILLVLLGLSGYSWAIIVSKIRRFSKLTKKGQRIMKLIGNHRGVEIMRLNLPMRDHPIALVIENIRQEMGPQFFAGSSKIEESSRAALFEGLTQCAEATVEEALEREERSVDFLAMTASVSPFLGLLGTVWGITQSFWEIGSQSSANIAVVAPGLAEALITTIAGLLVAIPAVIAFNIFTSQMRAIAGDVSSFSKRFVNQLKREL
ncbi:MotA/TolQ/ExbB proton channel family protein [bacterium]|nr:MotA/TolQ/ExbB proton channel family protein [bacterium]